MVVEGSMSVYRLLRPRWPLVVLVLALLVLVEIANDHVRFDRPVFSLAAVGLAVTALSIFLAFRVNEAYARWWEARMLWGDLVNASRSFARQATTLIGPVSGGDARVEAMQRELVHRQIAFANALRLSLRRQDGWDELAPFLGDEELRALPDAPSAPAQLLLQQGVRIAEARAAGILSDLGQLQLDRTLAALHDVQGGCERIKNTAFPEEVAYVTRFTAWLMALLVATAISDASNRFDPVDMVIVPLLMLGFVLVERVGADLRNPFEGAPNDTPMTALCRTIERDLRQALGEDAIPPEIAPAEGVLL